MAFESNSAEQLTLIDLPPDKTSVNQFTTPQGYKGIAAFHKYWGKKPVECISFLTELLTLPNETVVDPFMGSGLIAREALLRKRNFIGIDVNPLAIELSRLQLNLPDPKELLLSLKRIEKKICGKIGETYRLDDGRSATHYLWEGEELRSIWVMEKGRAGRQEQAPSNFDKQLVEKYSDYKLKNTRALKIFQNSRINAKEDFTWADLFTGRARYNIDLLLAAINEESEELRRAFLLSLTSASGQMSRMVFAITGRGKTTGTPSTKVEVGSWVIGYWRPKLHFEISVWRCFEKRVTSLAKAICELNSPRSLPYRTELIKLPTKTPSAIILKGDCRDILKTIPENTVGLILTDPPHSDRIPYLELSEMWNALMNLDPLFTKEIVVSNARKRQKTKQVYVEEMREFLVNAVRVLQPGRFLALMFNARDNHSWEFLSNCMDHVQGLELCGSVPMVYSANSVVQDNRKGSLKADFVVLYRKKGRHKSPINISICNSLPGWIPTLPERVIAISDQGDASEQDN